MSKPKVYTMLLGGAGEEVTGSSTALKICVNGKEYFVIIDAGIVQGKEEARNLRYPLNGVNLDFVIVTHAHADHFLGLPLLKNYAGKIYGTKEAFTLGYELMLDGVKSNVINAAAEYGFTAEAYYQMLRDMENIRKRFNGVDPSNYEQYKDYKSIVEAINEIESHVLYSYEDVENIRRHFCPTIPLEFFVIAKGVYGRFVPTSHQYGAVSVEIYVGELNGQDSVNLCFSGDLGPSDSLLYREMEPEQNPLVHYAWLESTHGIEERDQSSLQVYRFLKNRAFKTLKRHGTQIWLVHSLDRSAKVLFLMNCLIDETNISIPVCFDTPLGHRELMHYQNFYADRNNLWSGDLGKNPFDDRESIVCDRHADHIEAMQMEGAKIIITASAFGEGGRALDYFDRFIQDENAEFIFASWLSPDCASYKLLHAERGELIELNGKNYVKQCKTFQVTGLTSHAYYPEYASYLERFTNLKGVILNHGSREAKEELLQRLQEEHDFTITIPELYDDGREKSFFAMNCEEMIPISSLEGYQIFAPIMINR